MLPDLDFTDEAAVEKVLLEKQLQQQTLENRLAVLQQFLTKYGGGGNINNNTQTTQQQQLQQHSQQPNNEHKIRNSDSHETVTTSEKRVQKTNPNSGHGNPGVGGWPKNNSNANNNSNNKNKGGGSAVGQQQQQQQQQSQSKKIKDKKKREVFQTISRMIQKLMKHQDAKLFNEPVDVVKYCCPDYYRVIKQPMDFSTLLKNVEKGVYGNPLQVKQDMDLIWSNCFLYNGELHEVSLTGKRMQQTALRQWQNSGVVKKWEQIEAMEDSEQEPEPEPPAPPPQPQQPAPPPVTRPPPVQAPPPTKPVIQRKEPATKKRELKMREMDLLADDMFLPKRPKLTQKAVPQKPKKPSAIVSDEDQEQKRTIKPLPIPKRKTAAPSSQLHKEKQKQHSNLPVKQQRNGLTEDRTNNVNGVPYRQDKEASQRSNRASSDGAHGQEAFHMQQKQQLQKQKQQDQQQQQQQHQNDIKVGVVDETQLKVDLQNWIKDNFDVLTDDDHPRLMSCLGLEADVESGEVELEVDALTLQQLQSFKKFIITTMNDRKGGGAGGGGNAKYGSSSDGDEEVTSGRKKTSQNCGNYDVTDKCSPSSQGNISRMQGTMSSPNGMAKELQKRKLREMDVTDWYDLGNQEKSDQKGGNQSGVDSGGDGSQKINEDEDIWDEFKKIDSQRERKRQERERIQEAAESAQRRRAQDLKNYQLMQEQKKKQAREKQVEQELNEINAQINNGTQQTNEHFVMSSKDAKTEGGENGWFSMLGLRKKTAADEDMADTDEELI